MQIPVIRGLIDRRILVNFRVDPSVLAELLPKPFRPKLVRGFGVAGVCLIRLKHIRPRLFPTLIGLSSENAAHRIAVVWEQGGKTMEGVFVPRRDTSSRLNTVAGGRLFPGVHHYARFHVREQGDRYSVAINSIDGQTHLVVEGQVAEELPPGSLFGSLTEASDFFERGSLGYSVASEHGKYDGLELRTSSWSVQPLSVERIESSFFDDRNLFPSGSVEFDCALLMKEIEHEWHGRGTLCDDTAGSQRTQARSA